MSQISRKWLIMILIWPFGALLQSLRTFRALHSKTVFLLFCVYFGFVMTIPDNIKGAADSARYSRDLIFMHENWWSFDHIKTMFYNSEDGYTDIYQPVLTWIVAFFTDNPHWLFALFAGVFGFFYVQNLWIIFQRIEGKVKENLLLVLFLITFALTNPIWNINGVRMWTAAHVFVYGVLRYFLQKDKKGLIWASTSILFHFSFMFPVVVLFTFIIVPANLTILIVFFFASALISLQNFSFIRDNLLFLPEIIQTRVNSYTNEEFIQILNESRSPTWRQILANYFAQGVLYFWIGIAYFLRKKWIKELPDFKLLFAFALFFGGFSQLASNVASGSRFLTISNMLFYAVFVVIIGQKWFVSKFQVFKWITIPLLSFVLIFTIRVGMERIGFLVFFGNPVLAMFIEEKIGLIELIKEIF